LIRALTPKRPGDLTARYGGEEIGILLPNTDLHGAEAVAERIRAWWRTCSCRTAAAASAM
jgi:PleD family two-component response regulator